MAEPITIAKVGLSIAKFIGKTITNTNSKSSTNENSTSFKTVLVAGSALIFIVFLFISAPFELLNAVTNADKGHYGEHQHGSYVITDVDSEGNYLLKDEDVSISAQAIAHYKQEAHRLERYAKQKWSSGNGDVYTLPDWRWLWALDAVLSENDFAKVRTDKDTYAALHESFLKVKSSTKIQEVGIKVFEGVDEGTPGAAWDEEAQAYYTGKISYQEVTFWTVSHQSFDRIFVSGARGVTSELSYFIEYESGGRYGDGWGDGGAALGAYQFDYRYGLSNFLQHCYDFNQSHYVSFEPWLNSITSGDTALEAVWIAVYESYPEEFTRLQDEWAYENYYRPAEGIMTDLGISLEGRRDCIKGLVWGITNLFGTGGAKHGLSKLGLSDSMSDEELARTICGALASCDDFVAHWLKGSNTYREGWSRRYANELQTILMYLSQSPEASSELEGVYGDAQTKRLCANNYLKAVHYIDGQGNTLVLDYDALVRYLSQGIGGYLDATEIIAKAEEFLGYPYVWGGQDPSTSFDCSGFVWYVYHSTGRFEGGRPTADGFYDVCEKITETEARPGDLVFFTGTYGASDFISHIGIYAGDGTMIHTGGAPGVTYASIYGIGTSGPLFGRLPES